MTASSSCLKYPGGFGGLAPRPEHDTGQPGLPPGALPFLPRSGTRLRARCKNGGAVTVWPGG